MKTGLDLADDTKVATVLKETKMENVILRWQLKLPRGEHIQTHKLIQSEKEKEVVIQEFNASRERVEALQ